MQGGFESSLWLMTSIEEDVGRILMRRGRLRIRGNSFEVPPAYK